MAQESQQYPQHALPSPSNGLAAGFVVAGSDEGDTSRAARALESETSPRTHPVWCHFDRPGLLGGVEHISGLLEWRPSYMPDAAVLGWLRHVLYPDGSEETPVAVLQIDNPDQPGEIGMSADDLAALADRLLALRENLLD